MSADKKSRPSFSAASRWSIGLDAVVRTALAVAVVVMLNYLAAQFPQRFYLSSQTRVALSSRTVSVLHSLTNHVAVTLYYDRKDDFYPEIVGLLNEYRAVNPKISITTVDYVRDAGAAQKVMEQYRQFFSSPADKNLIVFDCDGRVKIFPGDALTQYKLEGVRPENPRQKELQFERRPVAFNGEMAFTTALIALENVKPLAAYFLQGHGEPSLANSDTFGYQTFGSVLAENYVAVTNLELLGDRPVPMDCSLLIIAAPTSPLKELELKKIDQYLKEGGRLLVLFDFNSRKFSTGLEPILQSWGVMVGDDVVSDPKNTVTGQDVIVRKFSQHPVVSALAQLSLQMVFPRPIGRVDLKSPPADAPTVDELVASSPDSLLANDPTAAPRSFPLMVAVEQKPVAGVANLRGNTRLIVAGDSTFLSNYYINGGGNRDFLNSAANWLLDRPQLTTGIGPRPVTEFRLRLTSAERQQVNWLLLGALPGVILGFGSLVWLVRRK